VLLDVWPSSIARPAATDDRWKSFVRRTILLGVTTTTRTTTPPGTQTDLAAHLRLSVTRLARRLRQHADAGVSPTQLAALATIERHGPITLGDLAAAERVAPPTITAAVGRLEQQDLAARRPDKSDKRVVRVTATAAGRRLLARNRSLKTAFLARRLDTLSSSERATLEEAAVLLDRLLDDRPLDRP
jgi:DNA-binding MarR family transcriptional regulator